MKYGWAYSQDVPWFDVWSTSDILLLKPSKIKINRKYTIILLSISAAKISCSFYLSKIGILLFWNLTTLNKNNSKNY